MIAEWWRRARERRALSTLDERDRHDLGISRCDAQCEAQTLSGVRSPEKVMDERQHLAAR